jgi:hypothetical protein
MNSNKFTVVLTGLCFFLSVTLNGVHGAGESVSPAQLHRTVTAVDCSDAAVTVRGFDVSLPASLGHITTAQDFGSDTVVINIQDLHCHPGTQRAIAEIIERIEKASASQAKVMVEGGYGQIQTSWINGISDSVVRGQIMQAMIDDGSLTGAEWYAMRNGSRSLLYGLEDEKLHKQNIVRLGSILKKRPETERIIHVLSRNIDRLKKRYFSAKNRRLDMILSQYRAGAMDDIKYYSFLNAAGREAGVISRTKDPFPAISVYLTAVKLFSTIRYKNVSQQLQWLVCALKNKLPVSNFQALAKASRNFTRPEIVVQSLRILHVNGIDWQQACPDLCAYASFFREKQEDQFLRNDQTGRVFDRASACGIFLYDCRSRYCLSVGFFYYFCRLSIHRFNI